MLAGRVSSSSRAAAPQQRAGSRLRKLDCKAFIVRTVKVRRSAPTHLDDLSRCLKLKWLGVHAVVVWGAGGWPIIHPTLAPLPYGLHQHCKPSDSITLPCQLKGRPPALPHLHSTMCSCTHHLSHTPPSVALQAGAGSRGLTTCPTAA